MCRARAASNTSHGEEEVSRITGLSDSQSLSLNSLKYGRVRATAPRRYILYVRARTIIASSSEEKIVGIHA